MSKTLLFHVIFLSTVCSSARADLLGQSDSFDAGVESWAGGANTTWISSSGGGYLQLRRPVSDPFHIATYNTAQWAGDYIAAGVTAFEVDLNQLAGPDTLKVRMVIWGDGGMWASKLLTPLSTGWSPYRFDLSDSAMVSVDGGGSLSATLQNVTRIQLRHDYPSPTPVGYHPEHISATLGVDNFEAVPEPETLAYFGVSGVVIYLARSRGREQKRLLKEPRR